MIMLPITLTIAGAAALLNLWLAIRVGLMRKRHGILIGAGGNAGLEARMRAQSNYVEYAPFFLILLALVELAIGSAPWLWAIAILFILGRIVHAFGMDRATINPLRGAGIGLTFLALLALAIYALALPYTKKRPAKITYAEASAASPTNGFVRRS